MKRRQVITGLLAVGAVGLLPHSMHRAMHSTMYPATRSNELVGDRHSVDSVVPQDIDPPLFDPTSDHENRAVLVPPSAVMLLGTSSHQLSLTSSLLPSSQERKDLKSSHQPLVNANEMTNVDAMAHTVEVQSQHAPKHVTSDARQGNTPSRSVSAEQLQINKAIYFEQDYADDIFVNAKDTVLLHSVHLRLKKLQSQVGYGHFNILNFDDALTFAKRYSEVGAFTPSELVFIEDIFSRNATDYGFYGEKVIDSLTTNIKKAHTFKVPHTGHYLFKEQSIQYYEKLRKHVGEGIILTSGIRSNVKQLHLFLAKVVRVNGNLSRASRSLAPPGYSYHGIGDFDVGRKGWGGKNFTDAFSQTDEFKRMQDLGYVTIRYDEGNTLGVRFEPWHIKVV